ncbi:MBL fold metallo-hydrolase [Halocatena halophila]|uniref:MBL fold metallo-hydrolase n=1 Tax=Halocatena halophila TaxID=2814576 RepID=UPI002ED39570
MNSPDGLDHPWLPNSLDDSFDPLAHADVQPSPETPLIVTPRGGAREVGRSCIQIDTQHGRYLVDCGLNQGAGEQFPALYGIEPKSIDAVFLTHAHIDHSGGLPVLTARGLLADDAPIIATPPTVSLATVLLRDSLKIHRQQAHQSGVSQQYTEDDLEDVFDRFTTINYGGGRIEGLAPVPDGETLVFQYGNAGHLLGSAWIMLQTGGYRVVLSGDLGGRMTQLPDITPPPSADLLVLESTYGDTHSHTAIADARSTLYSAVERAIQNREPVLLPTFAVGRAQSLLLLFAERLHMLSDELHDRVRLVVDGMAQEATEIYHEYVTDDTYMDESIVNRVTDSGWEEPFLPPSTTFPDSDEDRQRLLAETKRGEIVPVIIAPSGMLTGGNSPRYLVEFGARFDAATVLLTGYQALNTTGRALQNQQKAKDDTLTITTAAEPFGTDWPESPAVTWTSTGSDDPTERVTRATIPADWVETVDGLSAHAAQHGLLEFARTVGPDTIGLVHGPEYAQANFGTHLAANVAGLEQATRCRLLTPMVVGQSESLQTAAVSPEMLERTGYQELDEQLDQVYDQLVALNEEVAAARNDTGLSEAEIREIVRDELENHELAAGN